MAQAFPISSYIELVKHVARLAHSNRESLLFFRGQGRDYQNKSGASAFYPSIYREDNLSRDEIAYRFRRLESASHGLQQLVKARLLEGSEDLLRIRYVQWSILQHYEVVPTPLIDLTQSLRVACSFAMQDAKSDSVFVYVFAMPYITHRVSINSEQYTVMIRLLSISPPAALRPYFQEGYLAGTYDTTTEYDDKTDLDLSSRLVAKFSIPNKNTFWGKGLRALSPGELYPDDDEMKALCTSLVSSAIRSQVVESKVTSAVGLFLEEWERLEVRVKRLAQRQQARVLSRNESIRVFSETFGMSELFVSEIDRIRRKRDTIAFGASSPTETELRELKQTAADLNATVDTVYSKRGVQPSAC